MGRFKQFHETLIPVPVVYQSHSYDCGAAALRAVCQFWGVGPDDEDEFIKLCDSDPDLGTSPEDIIRVARGLGLKAVAKTGLSIDDLKGIIDSGKPVICAIQAWERDEDDEDEFDTDADHDSGHYVVAIGHHEQHLIFQDPSIKNNMRGHIPFEEFDRRWRDQHRNGSILKHFGIILWREDAPEKVDADARSTKIQ
jgi:predicted double-glycine peptidase